MFNRLARPPAAAAIAAPLPLVLRDSLLTGFAAEALVVPPKPAALGMLLRGEANDAAAQQIAATLFVVVGRDHEAALLHDCALATRRKARALAPLVGAPLDTVDAAGLLHRAGEACALRALAHAEAGTQVRLDAPSRAELCAQHQGQFTEQLIRDWELPPPVAEVLRTWRQFRATVSLAAAVVYYAHLLASHELHPEFFAPGLLRSVGAELGIDPIHLAAIA
ncbi:MAG: hypothetical protein CMLOHMNK_03135 [Steroidobacteraceae bacterium]|nr:hypothetical protein [Steroidobacteraceae bacterium]